MQQASARSPPESEAENVQRLFSDMAVDSSYVIGFSCSGLSFFALTRTFDTGCRPAVLFRAQKANSTSTIYASYGPWDPDADHMMMWCVESRGFVPFRPPPRRPLISYLRDR
jgi:hypothetical protein